MKFKNLSIITAMLMIVLLAACKKDEIAPVPPTVTSSDPANSAIGVTLGNTVVITFSEAMNQETINSLTITLTQEGTAVAGLVTSNDATATFTPSDDLEANLLYTGTVTIGVKNLAGTSMAENYIFSFTTGDAPDITPPVVNLTVPINNSVNVVRNKVVSITFSEPMNPITINDMTFTLTQGLTNVAGFVTYSGNTATFTSADNLAANTLYIANLSTEAKDIAGNALQSNKEWSFTTTGTLTGLTPVDLGSAVNYVILAKSAVNNISTSYITGDLGLSPAATSYITGLAITNATGYATSVQVTGKIYAADMADPTPINLTTAVDNMILAYNDAAGRPLPDFLELGTGNIGGKTLIPGLYKWTNTVTVPASITLSGNETDVWIFQIAGGLTVSSAVNVTLAGGAKAENIFWQVAGEAAFGTTSHFEGIILSMTGITFQTGASLNGRALAQTAVVLDANIITNP